MRHEKLRLDGYHEFYRATAQHRKAPLQIVSLWNTFLLAVQALLQHYYGDSFLEKCLLVGFLSPIVYITMFSSLETAVLSLVHGFYIGNFSLFCYYCGLYLTNDFLHFLTAKVVRFNKAAAAPDALQGSRGHSGGSLGLTQRGLSTAELLEKQADLINYLKDHNLKLNQKIMQMNAQVRTVTFPG